MSGSWTKSAVVMSLNEATAEVIIGEDIEPTKFALLEFPKEIRHLVKPGFSFNWTYCEGVFSISHYGSNPAG